MKILVMMTGGTIAQREIHGRMRIVLNLDDLLKDVASVDDVTLDIYQIDSRLGADLTFDTLWDIRNQILTTEHDGYVLVTGTDSMEELAFFLDYTINAEVPVVITGAMKPSDIAGYDGLSNLQQAIQVAADKNSRGKGVSIVINDAIHSARYVRKVDSQLIGAFQSNPGPIGQIRCGHVVYYYSSLPATKKKTDIKLEQLKRNIPIWSMAVGMQFKEEWLQHVDGLVIAGMGTGSISESLIAMLSPKWTTQMPIVLATRCIWGTNYDDYYYRGSREKYESKGFLLSDFKNYNPMQCRIALLCG